MKKGILALVLVLLVSMFAQPCLAAEASELVTFDGYDARKYDFNGVRVIYTLDANVLAELEKDYNVSVGVLLSAGITESAYETEMVMGKAKYDATFYSTEKGYLGKYYDKADGNKEFVYAVTFESAADKANLSNTISARAYVKLVSKTSGTDTVYYVDSNSAEFGKALSMKELAENFVATTDKNYPILQRLLNSNLKEMFINKISIDKFSVTGTAGTDVSAAIQEKLGYKLPIVETPYFADSYISAGEDTSLAQDVLYKITANGAVINIGYNSASKESAISKFKEILNENGSTVETTEGKVEKPKFKVTYDEDKFIEVEEGVSFSIPVISKEGYSFLGYFTEDDVQVADLEGNSLADFVLTEDITVVAKYKRVPTEADSANGQLLGNPLEVYYKANTYMHKISRNVQDLIVYDGKVYFGGGSYDGGWNPAPPVSVYDTATGTWGNVDFTVKMYEAFDADSTAKKWYELPATKSNSNNVSNQNAGIIPVTTDCEIANFKFINGKPVILGGDSINGNTWANGIVSTNTPTDGQKSVANNAGNYYIVEEDENGNDRWVEYRNHVIHAAHVYDVVEIEYNGEKTFMFAIGAGSSGIQAAKIVTNKATKGYLTPKFYLKDGTEYANSNNRIYNFLKTDEGIFAFYSQQSGTAKKIFKYNVVNGEHRFDEVRDLAFGSGTNQTRLFTQSDVNKSGTAISTRRLWTDFMRTETYNGYAYYTTGYLYRTKTFENSETTAISAPNSAIITDLAVRDGKLYALGFVKTNSSTNAYTNYIWSIDENDNFTQIRTFNTVGAYALSFDKDADFFYVGLGGPTTHITTDVTSVGDILKLSINPITE